MTEAAHNNGWQGKRARREPHNRKARSGAAKRALRARSARRASKAAIRALVAENSFKIRG